MRLVHLAAFVPLAFLVACGGNPQRGGMAGGPAPAGADGRSGQVAALPGGTGGDPHRLKGLSPTQVRAVLGKPMFTRRDAPAEIWQYRGRACTIDLFLYDEGGNQTVTHVAVRSQQPVNESQCMADLVSRAELTPAG